MPRIIIVPSCPRCGSIKTGQIEYGSSSGDQRLMLKRANLGVYTLVRHLERSERFNILPNCFCTDCRYEWLEPDGCESENVSTEEYHDYLDERGLWQYSIKNQRAGLLLRLVRRATRRIKSNKGE